MISVIVIHRKNESWKLTEESLLVQKSFVPITIIDYEDTDLHGCSYARNRGFEKSTKSDLVLFSDNDINWKPDALQVMCDTLISNPKASYCYGSYMIERADGTLYSNHQMPPSFDPNILVKGNYISAMTLIRTRDFPGFDENVGRLQDWDLWLTMLEQGKIGVDCHKLIFTTLERAGITKEGTETYQEAHGKVVARHKALCSTVFIKAGAKFKQTELFIAPHCDDETLFGAYTIMARKPLVAIFNDQQAGNISNTPEREAESAAAMHFLGVDVVFINNLDEISGDFDIVYAPMLEHGHPGHDFIHNAAKAKYSNVINYSTYRSGTDLLPRGQVKVEATEEMKQKKLDTLLFYKSQIAATPCHFIQANKDEYIDRKIENIAICAIVKDENEYLDEWIAYHKSIGINNFILYDNESAIPVNSSIKDHEGVLVIPIMGKYMEGTAYMRCIRNFKNNFNWIAFIDADEFIVMNESININEALKEYECEHVGGLGINWRFFGTSGHITKPDGGVIKNYTHCIPKANEISDHIKSIVHPRKVVSLITAHAFTYKPDYYCVNELRQAINNTDIAGNSFSPHSSTKFQINHYFTKSSAEWYNKMRRGRADYPKERTMDQFNNYESQCTDVDTSIMQRIDAIERSK